MSSKQSEDHDAHNFTSNVGKLFLCCFVPGSCRLLSLSEEVMCSTEQGESSESPQICAEMSV